MKNILLFSLILTTNFIFGQKTLKIAAIDQTKDFKKTLLLVPAFLGKYYKGFIKDSAYLKDGKYTFNISKGVFDTQKPFQLLMEIEKNKTYEPTDIFFLPTDTNIIYFDSKTEKVKKNKKTELVKQTKKLDSFLNPIEIENEKNRLDKIKQLSYKRNGYNSLLMKTIDSLSPDYKKLSVKEDSLLFSFSKKNPNSLALFWKIVEKISSNNYNPIFIEIYKNFSPKIKNSENGKILNQDLVELSKLKIGNKFPQINFENKNISTVFGKKYTLIDFWFSSCLPCLEAMEKYKQFYSHYKDRGFEIVAISTDREKDILYWKYTIEKRGLKWQNFRDKNKIETEKYSINSFPTTFLLDSEGKIIKKNISSEELENFLKEKLK